jgi:predicted RNase H-like nuclease (RuvC/YqgF family)
MKEKVLQILIDASEQDPTEKSYEMRIIRDNDFDSIAETISRLAPVSGGMRNKSKKRMSKTESIENALYATGRFTTSECEELASGIMQYLDESESIPSELEELKRENERLRARCGKYDQLKNAISQFYSEDSNDNEADLLDIGEAAARHFEYL